MFDWGLGFGDKVKANWPTLLSTLGILGTFIGITLGLLKFDVGNINASIPVLIDGLKTAFFTSIVGMLTSLIFKFN
jgi:hypothetical protein